MHLISTAKTTILTKFENLENKSIYYHANGENRDFQAFTAQQCLFVEVNQQSGLEILRIKEAKNQNCNIQRVRKLTVDGVYCVACPKQSLEEVAVGLANGQVKLYNYKRIELVHKFSSDSSDNSVLFLDYNALDEYIAGVFENGSINIYGYKTKKKLEKINIDSQSTLARFHPCKRFHLSIASYKGSVTVYDIQAKCKIYNSTEAHTAPCRDLCMTPAKPDILISAGYDCLINIYDTRRKIQPTQLKYCHPLSTVAVSECGQYFCVGNLKGELTTYDMRNLNDYLMTKKIHESAVTRVAFAPNAIVHGNDASNLTQSNGTQTTATLISESFNATGASTSSNHGRLSSINKDGNLRVSFINRSEGETVKLKYRDSFGDFLDFHSSRGQENCSPRHMSQRDSFDWDALSRKPIKDSNNSETVTASVAEIIQKQTASDDHHDITNSKLINLSMMNDINLMQPLKDRSNLSTGTSLAQIKERKHEEAEQVEEYERSTCQLTKNKAEIVNNCQTINDCEAIKAKNLLNPEPQQYEQIMNVETINQHQNILQPFECKNSTPTIHYQQNGAGNVIKFQRLSETLSPTPPSLSSTPSPSPSGCCKPQSSSTTNDSAANEPIDKNVEHHLNIDQENAVIMNAIQSLRDEMLERFRQLEFELKFHADRNKWELFTQNLNLWQEQTHQSEQIQQACNILTQSDPFVKEFIRLKEENEILKEKLKKKNAK